MNGIRPLNCRGAVTFVATKVTKNAVSANGFLALAGRTGWTRPRRTNKTEPKTGNLRPGYLAALLPCMALI